MYQRPLSLLHATEWLARGPALLLGGGTDVFPAHVGRAITRDVIDLTRVAEMLTIGETEQHYRLGGAVTWSRLVAAPLPRAFDALKQAAREIGSQQIQNRGTLAGNLCNASPAADSVPPLLALDADVELASCRAIRHLPLEDFLIGYRKTSIAADEILSTVRVPKAAAAGCSAFVKLGSRRYLVISILMAAARLTRSADGRIGTARVAVGSASPVACRLTQLESNLAGLPSHILPSAIVARHHLSPLAPIGDGRATAAYRQDAALHVVGQALDQAYAAGAA